MDNNVVIAIIAACAVVISAICVLGGAVFAFLASNKRMDDIRTDLKALTASFDAFKDIVNGKLRDLDTEIGKLLDRSK